MFERSPFAGTQMLGGPATPSRFWPIRRGGPKRYVRVNGYQINEKPLKYATSGGGKIFTAMAPFAHGVSVSTFPPNGRVSADANKGVRSSATHTPTKKICAGRVLLIYKL